MYCVRRELNVSPCLPDPAWDTPHTTVPIPGTLALVLIGLSLIKWLKK